jgi:hypothetical protein
MKNAYTNIRLEPTFNAKLNYLLRKSIGFLVCRVFGFQFLMRLMAGTLTAIQNCAKNYSGLSNINSVEKTALPNQFGSRFGYDDESAELDAVLYYRSQIRSPHFADLPSESHALYQAVFEEYDRIVASDPSVTNMLDFGVSYAHVDSVLARKYPNTMFLGCDRSEPTMMINRLDFGSIKNLSFFAGDIFDCIERQERIDVFFHMRTACLLPAEFVEKLYTAARSKGAKYVLLAEQVGLSWETGKAYNFSDDLQPSVALRWKMMIHNYPYLLKQAGFTIGNHRLLATNHNDPNLRILLMVAKLS